MKAFQYREQFPLKGESRALQDVGKMEYALTRSRQRALKELPKEREKTPELLEQIRVVNQILAEEVKSLGGEEFRSLLPEQFHFLEPEEFAKYGNYEGENIAGLYSPFYDRIYLRYDPEMDQNPFEGDIDWDILNDTIVDGVISGEDAPEDETSLEYKLWDQKIGDLIESETELLEKMSGKAFHAVHLYRLVHTMLHEAVHATGAQRFHAGDRKLGSATGYDVIGKRQKKQFSYFSSLNEAVVERMTLELMQKNWAQVEKTSVPVTELEAFVEACDKYDGAGILHPFSGKDSIKDSFLEGSYEAEREILEIVLQKVAQYKKESVEETWTRFKRGYLTGSMMHLRDIEGAFGPGTLRVYANAKAVGTTEGDRKLPLKKMRDFLLEPDEQRRRELGEELLQGKKYEMTRYTRRHESAKKKKAE